MTLRDHVQRMLAMGWLPWVRKDDAGNDEEVWARSDNGDEEPQVLGPVSAEESDLITDLMQNRVLK